MERTRKFEVLTLIIIVGFTSAVIFHNLNEGLGLAYPHNTFLFAPQDRFNDFFNPLRGSADLDPYNPERIGYVGGYLPFGYVVAYLLSLVQPKGSALILFLAGFILYLWAYLSYSLFRTLRVATHDGLILFSLTLMAYPVLFILDRANFDIVVFALLSLFAIGFQRKHGFLSAIMLACAIAMKGYPAILLALFIVGRRYRDFLAACLASILLTLGSLALLKGGLIPELYKMLASFPRASAIAFGAGNLIRFNSSLYTALLYVLGERWPHLAMSTVFNWGYLLLAVLVGAATCCLMFRIRFPEWINFTLVMGLLVLLPQSSGDYRLVLLYIPLVAFLNSKEPMAEDRVVLVAFALLLIPKAYFILRDDVNIGLLLNPLLLILLLGATLAAGLRQARKNAAVDRGVHSVAIPA